MTIPKPKNRSKAARRANILRVRNTAKAYVRSRDRGLCVLCGKPASQVHHVIYLSHGGADTPDNMLLLCDEHHEAAHFRGNRVALYVKARYDDGEHTGWEFSGSKSFSECKFVKVRM